MAKRGTLGPMQPQPDFLLASFPALPTTHPSLWPYQTLLISLACDFVHVLTFFLPHLFLGLANLCLPWEPSSDVTSSLKWCLYNCWRLIKLSLPLCALILYRCVPLYSTLFIVEAYFSVWPTKLLSFCTADNHPQHTPLNWIDVYWTEWPRAPWVIKNNANSGTQDSWLLEPTVFWVSAHDNR